MVAPAEEKDHMFLGISVDIPKREIRVMAHGETVPEAEDCDRKRCRGRPWIIIDLMAEGDDAPGKKILEWLHGLGVPKELGARAVQNFNETLKSTIEGSDEYVVDD